MRAALLAGCALLVACAPAPEAEPGGDGGPGEPDAGTACDPQTLTLPGESGTLELAAGCTARIELAGERIVEVTGAPSSSLWWDGDEGEEPGWIAPRARAAGAYVLAASGDGVTNVTVHDHGTPVGDIVRERSLVFTRSALVDDGALVGLAPLMAALAADGHGGRLLAAWFLRFASTAHSERAGPGLLLEDHALSAGEDASAWDLASLPFVVTAVHNRLDLKGADACGELRVSLASSHATYAPFHLIFLFEQPALPDDRSPAGTVHCQGTARRWAALSVLDDTSFMTEARALLTDGLTGDRFLLAESVEFIIAPWEWRQWKLVPAPAGADTERVFDNPPLFQTVDIPALNTPGALRDDFLSFVEDNAAALNERSLLLPERFRSPSARVNDGVPWIPLDLDGADPDVLASFPSLRGNVEIVGCHACHAADADFVQTRPDRTFSTFYDKELDARAAWLFDLQRGQDRVVPFGPLQADPVLP